MRVTQSVLEILTACNFNCSYCRDDSGAKRMLRFEEIARIVDSFKELGIMKVQLDGGEPFLHPDIFAVIDHIVESGLLPGCYTNASMIDASMAARLASYPDLKLAVTLHPLNDAREIEGTFRGIGHLHDHGIHPNLILVVSSGMLAVLTSTVSRLPKAKYRLVLNPLVPSGRAYDNKIQSLNREEMECYRTAIAELDRDYPLLEIVDNVATPADEAGRIERIQLNDESEFALHINTNGDVLPFFSASPEAAIGNINNLPALKHTLSDPKTHMYLQMSKQAMSNRIAKPLASNNRRILREEILQG
jgi:MoaA/NifB/PqqE/SkfB family radical SAM enzyme